jgi:PKHD-type hydroxylase
MFLRIAKLLSEEQLATVRATLSSDTAPWVDGRVTAGHQGAPVKHNQQLDEASPMARELGNFVLMQLERNALFISAVLPNKVYPPMFNRYCEGMHFGTHVDGSVRMIPGSPQKLRTDLSATLFLAEPQSYGGGELVVETDFGGQSAKYAAGDLIVYSASLRHRVNAITHGERLASVFWIQSLIREDSNSTAPSSA